MGRVSGTIPSFHNGVSQQTPYLRLPTQVERSTNRYPTLTVGNIVRPPAEILARIPVSIQRGGAHIIDRGSDSRFVALFVDERLRVFDLDGVEQEVSAPDGWSYLSGITEPSEQLRVMTVADYTFVSNAAVTVANRAATSPVRAPEALINIVGGNYERTFEVSIDGAVRASFKTVDGSSPDEAEFVAADYIASQLFSLLNGSLGATFTFTRYKNVIHVVRQDGGAFSIGGDDGQNGDYMKIVTQKTRRFTDLPIYGPVGYVVEVKQSDGTELDNYWVVSDVDGAEVNSRLSWRETLAPGTPLGLDAATMPHVLVHNPDDTFIFKRATWDDRRCGDEKISPNPSFVGRTVWDVFMYRNRFGILADENVILSRSGAYFDFYRTTASTLLDDDPIDVAAGSSKVSFMRYAVPMQEALVLFSDSSQFRLAGNELLTPKTVNMRNLAEYPASRLCRPLGVGVSVFFALDPRLPKAHAGVWEMLYDRKTESIAATELTSHVPDYIPSGITQLAGSEDESLVLAVTGGDPSAIYAYRYFWSGEEKVQSAWGRWEFTGATVLSVSVVDSIAYVIFSVGHETLLEKIDLDTAATDAPGDYKIALDHRLTAVGGAYSRVTNTTEVSVPRIHYAGIPTLVAGSETAFGAKPAVVNYVLNVPDTWTFTLRGNWTGTLFYVGQGYTAEIEQTTPIFYRAAAPGGQPVAVTKGRLQVDTMTLAFSGSCGFEVEVRREGREPAIHVYSPNKVSGASTLINVATPQDGTFTFPIKSRSDRVEIILRSPAGLPTGFMSATWEGRLNKHHRGG